MIQPEFPYTIDDIKRAYEVTGLRPVTAAWLELSEGQWCGCPITALAMARGMSQAQIQDLVEQAHAIHTNDLMLRLLFAVRLGITLETLHDFTVGLDLGLPPYEPIAGYSPVRRYGDSVRGALPFDQPWIESDDDE